MMEKLSGDTIQDKLQRIHEDWILNAQNDHIERTFQFEDFYQTMAFANAVAWIANKLDHHPDLQISYKTCHILYTTHSAKGLTELDFTCAEKIDQLIDPAS